jgi:hypothetical protein
MQPPSSSTEPSDRHLVDRLRWPWMVLGVWVLLAAASVALNAGDPDATGVFALLRGPLLGGYAVVGALVCTRRDGRVVGGLMLAVALSGTVAAALHGYGMRAGFAPGWPAWDWALWLGAWLAAPFDLLLLLFLPLVFPSGRLPSPRWRIVAALGVVLIAAFTMNNAIRAEYGPDWFDPAGPLLRALVGVLSPMFLLLVCVAIGGLVLRLRRARGVERAQLKWLVYAALLLATGLILLEISFRVEEIPFRVEGPSGGPGPIHAVGSTLTDVMLLVGLPVAIGVAVLRYRLYDIDVVIRRTIVYSVLSAMLGGAYLACVLVLRELWQPLAGESGLAVAVSTLGVAVLFRPARTWVGAAVDRRFYRGRYDTARTLSAFGARLQHEFDADTVSRDMRAVVHETLHPTHVSVWLLDPKKRR